MEIIESDVNEEEMKFLLSCLEDNCYYVELGIYFGHTLNRIINLSQGRGIKYVGIDLFEDFRTTEENTHKGCACNSHELLELLKSKYPNEDIVLIKDETSVGIKQLPKFNGLCFIDADHSYHGCYRDFEAVIGQINRGYIVLHNTNPDSSYTDSDGGPRKVGLEALGRYDNIDLLYDTEKVIVLKVDEHLL